MVRRLAQCLLHQRLTHVAPAPAVYVAPAPVVEYVAGTPVVKFITPYTAVREAPEPAVEHIAPSHAVYSALALVVEHIAPAHVAKHRQLLQCILHHRLKWNTSLSLPAVCCTSINNDRSTKQSPRPPLHS